ncbi:MAG: lipopolysaccharide biosynthesis protein [Firmicutes bacterium]|nr:lipopolysaccharide biosynthesis protein [Bacillota bacterium]
MAVELVAKIRLLGRQLLTPGESLARRVVHAGFWAFALRIVERLFGFARTVVLARLLSPKDFGLFGIAMLALSALETFSQTGFEAALIQKKDDVKPYLNTAWTVQILRGLVLAGILAASAPFVAGFFGEPKAAMLLRVLALGELAKGFTNIGVVFFRKELEFHKQFIYMLTGTLADFAVAILAALLLRNAWALAYGLLAGNVVRMVVSYLVCPYHPRLQLEVNKARELHSFGRWIFASSILVFLLNHGDDVLVGKLLGTVALGLYQMAYAISNLPATEITHVVSQVTFPTYSKLQDSFLKLRRGYLQTFYSVAVVSLPLAGAIVVFARDFTLLFLGKQWLEMIPALQVLTIWGVIRSLGAMTAPLWQAVGKPYLSTVFQLAKLVLLCALIYPLTQRWGILGTAVAVTTESVLVHVVGYVAMAKTLNCRVRVLVLPLVRPTLATGVMLLAALGLSRTVGTDSFAGLLAVGLVTGIFYLAAFMLLGRLMPAEDFLGQVPSD